MWVPHLLPNNKIILLTDRGLRIKENIFPSLVSSSYLQRLQVIVGGLLATPILKRNNSLLSFLPFVILCLQSISLSSTGISKIHNHQFWKHLGEWRAAMDEWTLFGSNVIVWCLHLDGSWTCTILAQCNSSGGSASEWITFPALTLHIVSSLMTHFFFCLLPSLFVHKAN